jgi:hypothetical protein
MRRRVVVSITCKACRRRSRHCEGSRDDRLRLELNVTFDRIIIELQTGNTTYREE